MPPPYAYIPAQQQATIENRIVTALENIASNNGAILQQIATNAVIPVGGQLTLTTPLMNFVAGGTVSIDLSTVLPAATTWLIADLSLLINTYTAGAVSTDASITIDNGTSTSIVFSSLANTRKTTMAAGQLFQQSDLIVDATGLFRIIFDPTQHLHANVTVNTDAAVQTGYEKITLRRVS